MAKGGKLTPKQELFVAEYCKDYNGSAAAIRAGYSEKTARQIAAELLTKHDIKKVIMANKEEVKENIKIDAAWVLQKWFEIANRCTQSEPVLNKEGNPIGEWKFEPNAANRSLELIAKHIGMFIERQHIQVSTEATEALEKALVNPEVQAMAIELFRKAQGEENIQH
jgi:phage terminase small subunit